MQGTGAAGTSAYGAGQTAQTAYGQQGAGYGANATYGTSGQGTYGADASQEVILAHEYLS